MEPEGAGGADAHPSPATLERFMRSELEQAEHQAVVRHLLAGCERCRSITARLWNHGARETISLIEMLASPKTLARHRRRARSKQWDPRMSAAAASLESVSREAPPGVHRRAGGAAGPLGDPVRRSAPDTDGRSGGTFQRRAVAGRHRLRPSGQPAAGRRRSARGRGFYGRTRRRRGRIDMSGDERSSASRAPQPSPPPSHT